MVVPPNGKGTMAFRIPAHLIKPGIAIGLCILTVLLGVIYLTMNKTFSLGEYTTLQYKADTQDKKFNTMKSDMDDLQIELETLIRQESEVRQSLGMPPAKLPKSISKKQTPSASFFAPITDNTSLIPTPTDITTQKIALLREKIASAKASLERFRHSIQPVTSRYAATPSIWPVRGVIDSEYGYRYHPITGRYQLHKGVDIAAYIGAEAHSGAQGTVRFTGWKAGYGLCVVIDHGYGYKTLYGHLSKINVHQGDFIKKGQSIALVGSTGLSTGPHLHYEVQRWGQAVEPRPFLGATVLTAKNQFWQ